MNIDDNRLYDLSALPDYPEANPDDNILQQLQDLRDRIEEEAGRKDDSVRPVPARLEHAARRALKGEKQVQISRKSGGKLSKWAAHQRRNR